LIDSFEERADWPIYVSIKIVAGKFGGQQGGKVLCPARHSDWASCAFLSTREG